MKLLKVGETLKIEQHTFHILIAWGGTELLILQSIIIAGPILIRQKCSFFRQHLNCRFPWPIKNRPSFDKLDVSALEHLFILFKAR
jgi:hypothetical protein